MVAAGGGGSSSLSAGSDKSAMFSAGGGVAPVGPGNSSAATDDFTAGRQTDRQTFYYPQYETIVTNYSNIQWNATRRNTSSKLVTWGYLYSRQSWIVLDLATPERYARLS